MAIKEWTTNYPVTQDLDPVTGVQPDLVNESVVGAGDGDDTRSSQAESLRDKLHATAKLVGDSSDLPATSLKATTLKNTAGDWVPLVEKVVPVTADILLIEDSADGGSKKRVQIGNVSSGSSIVTVDTPPTSPSVYDDEFDGAVLDPKWAWAGIGEPVGAGEVWGLKYNKLYFKLNGADHGNPPGHALQQDIPSIAGDWVAITKLTAAPRYSWHREGLFVSAGTNANWVHFVLGFNGGHILSFDRWVGGGVTYEQGRITLDGYSTAVPVPIYLAVRHVTATTLFRFYWSWDGCAWTELSASFDYSLWGANVPTKVGLVMWQACYTAAQIALVSWDWFRVYNTLP